MSISSRIAFALVATASMLAATNKACAQASESHSPGAWELRFTSGALVPTGSQRNVLKDAQISTAQLSVLVRPSIAITGTLGWARSRDLSSTDTEKLDVFTSDIGVEARASSLFAGVGVGARSYNYRNLDIDATNNLAGYGAVGGDLDIGRVGVRLEARNYVTGFKPLGAIGRSGTRNDVVVTAALSFNRQ